MFFNKLANNKIALAATCSIPLVTGIAAYSFFKYEREKNFKSEEQDKKEWEVLRATTDKITKRNEERIAIAANPTLKYQN